MTHTILLDLKGQKSGRRSKGVFSYHPNGTLVVFVHGFTGSPEGTWRDFPALLPTEPRANGADAMFFGYDSVFGNPADSAKQLREFMDVLWTSPAACWPDVIAKGRAGKQWLGYSKLVLVAHSLGAVVSRLALHDALARPSGPSWGKAAQMVLFAPAHKGAYRKEFIDLLGQTLLMVPKAGRIFKITRWAIQKTIPAAEHLQPKSKMLVDLENTAVELDRKKGLRSATAKRTVFGSRDLVVLQIPFGCDPPAGIARGDGHTSVCKPRIGTNTAPLTEVRNYL